MLEPYSASAADQPGDWIGALWRNLRSALPLLTFRRVDLARFTAPVEQALLLFAALIALYFLHDALTTDWPAELNLRALPATLAGDIVLLACVLLYTRVMGHGRLGLPIFVGLQSLWVWLTLIYVVSLVLRLPLRGALFGAQFDWALLIYCYLASLLAVLRWLPGRIAPRVLAALLLHALVFVCANYYADEDLWVAQDTEAPATPPLVTEEAVLQAQSTALARELRALKPQRAEIDDLYLVAFGGDAAENVFMHEVNAARKVFEQRFDALGRSVSLINNDRTVRDTPIASASNLAAALKHLGGIINRERDLVALYLTTHGSEQHELSVSYEPLQLQQIDPFKLKQMLDEAGIKWRLVFVSACYAGGFIEPLKDAHTLIITAADATHTSFGCGPDSDMTYFGRAYVEHALQQTLSFTEAFERAKREIAQREQAEGEEHSNPQMYVGAALAEKLRTLQGRLGAK